MAQLETNVYGPLAVTQAALPHFRARRGGLVINVGSLEAKVPFPFTPLYVASKFALDGLTEALNLELVPLGIRVKIVHPGVVETSIISNMDMAENEGVDDYAQLTKSSREAFPELFEGLRSSAEHIASVLYEAATDGTEKVRYPAGKDSLQLLAARREKNDEEWEREISAKFKLTLDK